MSFNLYLVVEYNIFNNVNNKENDGTQLVCQIQTIVQPSGHYLLWNCTEHAQDLFNSIANIHSKSDFNDKNFTIEVEDSWWTDSVIQLNKCCYVFNCNGFVPNLIFREHPTTNVDAVTSFPTDFPFDLITNFHIRNNEEKKTEEDSALATTKRVAKRSSSSKLNGSPLKQLTPSSSPEKASSSSSSSF